MNRRQLKSHRFLPMYVTPNKDRHGTERLRFRRKGFPSHYFKAALGTEDFRIEYAECMNPATARAAVLAEAEARTVPGTLADLFARYVAVPERLGPTAETQKKVRAVLARFVEGRGDRAVRAVTFEHIDAIIARRRAKVQVGGRWEGGVEAARKLRKELVRLFDFAVKIELLTRNPARQASTVRVAAGERTTGFHSWTEYEIAQFRSRWALGTMPRLAMEMMLWTDQRKVDTIHLGRQHIKDGRFKIRQTKGGKQLEISIAPQLLEAIVAMPPNGGLCFLTTSFGKPFSVKGFGGWFRDRCNDAGLPHCTAHGLRKATMRRMAERNMSNQTMKSMSGHTNDDEVAIYTAAANQIALADEAIAQLSRWEKSSLQKRLDTDFPQVAENAG